MFMNQRTVRFPSLFPSANDLIFPTFSFERSQESTSTSKSKEGGPSRIDVSISLFDSSTQKSTSVSFSKELPIQSLSLVRSAMETFVKDVEEVNTKESSGSTPMEGSSPTDG